ncbi:MAG TPA: FAD-dependent monooxygenase [Anaerolineae bacterium]|nr:FAD-dependent monooxygenase [Anaerolineae bacterium]
MTPTTQQTQHAIIIGASMAGLWTAQALAPHFAKITILDRDQLPTEVVHRRGLPQAHHLHVLLARGVELLNDLFPGLHDELVAAGANSFDLGSDINFHRNDEWYPPFHTGITGLSCSRLLLETAVRHRVSQNPNIQFITGADVHSLITSADNSQILGVRVNWRRGADQSAPKELHADLIIDNSGRASRTPQWLEELGYGQVEEIVVDAHLGYATRRYEKVAMPGCMLAAFADENNPRGGMIIREENGGFVLTLGGTNDDRPPTDEAGFNEFIKDLPPEFSRALRHAVPTSKISGYRRTRNQWRRFDKMPNWPDRFVVLGDAMCGFNPIYGQGMTVAGLCAATLGQMIADNNGQLDNLAHRYQKRIASIPSGALELAITEDYRFPTTEGTYRRRGIHLIHRYFDIMSEAMKVSPFLYRRFIQVQQLLKPAYSLFSPLALAHIAWGLVQLRRRPATAITQNRPAIA